MNDPLINALDELGGHYQCPKDPDGKRLGPLVAYVGEYLDEASGTYKKYVGDEYWDLTPLLRRSRRTVSFIGMLAFNMRELEGQRLIFCGMPYGGITIANSLAGWWPHGECIFPEKKVIALETSTSKEQSQLVFSRHEVLPGMSHVIVDDVVNDGSTSGKGIDLIESKGGIVVAVACFLNQSPYEKELLHNGNKYPIVTITRKESQRYRQDDPFVAEDVTQGNVCWNPKANRKRLHQLMQDANKQK